MFWLDIFTTYLYGLKTIAVAVAVVIFISSLDDLFIDLVYWCRRIWRRCFVYTRHRPMGPDALMAQEEQPLAIMVPAWQEHGVVGAMAQLAATTLDYENYHIFIGTYPNDPQTQAEVEQVRARFPNMHSVVCARPGPTSKADCLNNVLEAIWQFEQRSGMAFAGFILHDAEDVLSPLELRLFNHLVGRKDLIQLPVYPLERPLFDLTGGHYLDEFAEMHAKDVVVREALVGQVPSAGVGTCFSRRAIAALREQGNGMAFDTQSLTEDYNIGFRLKQLGMKEAFVRFPDFTPGNQPGHPQALRHWGRSARQASMVAVREFFPNTVGAAVRQKSRWITGIVIQGYRTLGWTPGAAMNYFLWRDRKGVITNFASFLGSLLAVQLLAIWAYQQLVPDSYRFLSIFQGERWFSLLLAANFVLMLNRVVQRMYFVTANYGLAQGLMAVPRLLWGNLVNFLANWRAVAQALKAQDIRRMAWAKTDHDFPSLGDAARPQQALEQVLLEQRALTPERLQHAQRYPMRGLSLGQALVHRGEISGLQLAAAIAAQHRLDSESLQGKPASGEMATRVPCAIALHYRVLPLREEGDVLVVACETPLDPVSFAALQRKLRRPVRCVVAPTGEVTVELRRLYDPEETEPAHELLAQAVHQRHLTATQARSLWLRYVSRQVQLSDVLLALGAIDPAVLATVLLRQERAGIGLGELLVQQGVIATETLSEARRVQRGLQPTMAQLLYGARTVSHAPLLLAHDQ
ncbi:glycosyl transferase family protein [Comamonas odontotermitis]|uniref:glycosyl transferase family protein n=1 Tax=Comamonas odontotermitis TaxID=379895 RepID=UPI0037519563